MGKQLRSAYEILLEETHSSVSHIGAVLVSRSDPSPDLLLCYICFSKPDIACVNRATMTFEGC